MKRPATFSERRRLAERFKLPDADLKAGAPVQILAAGGWPYEGIIVDLAKKPVAEIAGARVEFQRRGGRGHTTQRVKRAELYVPGALQRLRGERSAPAATEAERALVGAAVDERPRTRVGAAVEALGRALQPGPARPAVELALDVVGVNQAAAATIVATTGAAGLLAALGVDVVDSAEGPVTRTTVGELAAKAAELRERSPYWRRVLSLDVLRDLNDMLRAHDPGAACWCGTGADPEHDRNVFPPESEAGV